MHSMLAPTHPGSFFVVFVLWAGTNAKKCGYLQPNQEFHMQFAFYAHKERKPRRNCTRSLNTTRRKLDGMTCVLAGENPKVILTYSLYGNVKPS